MKKLSKYMLLLFTLLPCISFILNLFEVNDISFIWWMLILIIGYSGIILLIINLFKGKIKYNKRYIFILLFFIVYIITTFFSNDLKLSIIGNSYRHNGLLTFISCIGIFFHANNLDKKEIKTILSSICVVGSILCFLCLMDNLFELYLNFNLYKYSSVFYNPNHFAYYLVIVLSILVGNVVFEENIKNTISNVIQFIIVLIVFILNNTFGSYLAYISILFLFLIKKKRNLLKIIIIFIITLFLSLTISNSKKEVIVLKNFDELFSGLQLIDKSNSQSGSVNEQELYRVGNRYILWKVGLKLIYSKPLTGYGPDNLFSEYVKNGVVEDLPHNEFIQMGATNGVICLILYLFAILSIIFKKNNFNGLTFTITITLIGYLISSFFGNSMFYTTPYLYIILGFLYNLKQYKNV